MPRSGAARRAPWFAGLLVALVACGGSDDGPVAEADLPPGFWFDDAFPAGAAALDAEARAELEALTGIGYASGYEEAGPERGVVRHDADRAVPGWNLYTSGHGPEAILMDMQGAVLHRWSLAYEAVRDTLPEAPPMVDANMRAWRRAVLFPDGALAAIHEGLGVVKVDRDSNLVWAHFGGEHHDLVLDETSGHLFVLTQRERVVPRLPRRGAVLDDAITELDAEGRVVRTVSLTEALLGSPWGNVLARQPDGKRDLLHANSLERVDERLAAGNPNVRAGQWLVCLRDLDAVATVDLDTARLTWFWEGGWKRPHDPTVGEDGAILIFDNLGRQPAGSRVVERAPGDAEPSWSWSGADGQLFSPVCGAVSRLPGGHVLVTDSCRGRAHEVTAAGEVVWTFVSPHRTGVGGRLVAALFEVVRLTERPSWLP